MQTTPLTHRTAAYFGAAPGSLGCDDALIALADPALDSRIAIVSPGALDLACALLRGGYHTASIVRLDDRMRAHQADAVIIPHPATAGFLASAIPFARRLLAPLGVLALRLPEGESDAVQAAVQRQLLLHGFTGLQVRTSRGNVLLSAELPLHGKLACA